MKKKSQRAKALSKIKHHNFAGNKYRLKWEKPVDIYNEHGGAEINGLCEDPSTPNRKITIDPDLPEKELLATMIDEGVHASIWQLENDFVDKLSDSLSEFLWRAGFRLTMKKKSRTKN
jgi:hypothetical protein